PSNPPTRARARPSFAGRSAGYRDDGISEILHLMSGRPDAATLDHAARAGFQHHQAGRLVESEQIYRQVLSHNPNHFDALQLLGLIALSTGHAGDAVTLL